MTNPNVENAKLTLPADLSFEDWHQLGDQLQRITNYFQWWWGDWLNYGESRYGEKYRVAVEKFGLNLHTAQQYAWVAREYETCDRSQVSWTHYKVAASIQDEAERAEILAKAGLEGWSVAKLRREIKAALTGVPDPAADCSAPATRITDASVEGAELDERRTSRENATPPTSLSAPAVTFQVVQSEIKSQDCHEASAQVPCTSLIACPRPRRRREVAVSHIPVLAEELRPLLTTAAIRIGDLDRLKQILAHIADFCDVHPDKCTVLLKHFKKLTAAPKTTRSRFSSTGDQASLRERSRFGLRRRITQPAQRLFLWSGYLESGTSWCERTELLPLSEVNLEPSELQLTHRSSSLSELKMSSLQIGSPA